MDSKILRTGLKRMRIALLFVIICIFVDSKVIVTCYAHIYKWVIYVVSKEMLQDMSTSSTQRSWCLFSSSSHRNRMMSDYHAFSSGHVWLWELDYKESWALKNWCFWTVVLEKTLEGPLHCKEIQPVHPKGDQSWVFFGSTDIEAETPILWPPNAKSWLIGKDPEAGKDWGQEEKGMTEDKMVG